MYKMMIRHFLAMLGILGCAACANPVSTRTDVRMGVAYNDYKTFSVLTRHPLLFTAPQAMVSGVTADEIAAHIRRTLEKKGLTAIVADNSARPDIYFAFTYGTRGSIRVYANYAVAGDVAWIWNSDPRIRTYTDDTLSLDAFDGKTGNAVWHSYAPLHLRGLNAAEQNKRILQVATSLIINFPPNMAEYMPKQSGIIFVY
jgi:hypothetical protein